MRDAGEGETYTGKRVTVMGLGAFGGGVGAARFLAERGAHVTVTDLKPPEELRDSLAALQGLPIACHLDGHLESDFTEADLVVVNPAVPPTSRFLAIAAMGRNRKKPCAASWVSKGSLS